MNFRGIKKRLFLQFWILFFLAMLLVDVLVVFIVLERNISQKIERKRHDLITICEHKAHPIAPNGDRLVNAYAAKLLGQNNKFLFIRGSFKEASLKMAQRRQVKLEHLLIQTLKYEKEFTKKHTLILGWFFFQHQFVVLTCPVKTNGHAIAAGGIEFSLSEEYQAFNQIQKTALVFIVTVSFFFALIGNQQLLRLYYRPLKRLSKLAETFRDEDNLFFSVRKEDNEFSVLSSSLNKMLNRIAEDKRVLKDTIGSLKKTNQELKKAQNDVIRAEKMASVGRLTSGIAHEIGNPIGIVLGYLDLLKQSDLSSGERIDFIERSEKEITRINHIIRQLLDMSRPSAEEAKPVSIHSLLEELVSVFRFQPTASHITFDFAFSAICDNVFADPDQIRQVFLNILLNAVDAVNAPSVDKACITLITEPVSTIPGTSTKHSKSAIKVTIKDNGPGIEALHLPRVFDPFYTTKQPGKGTGLGLSVSFMIVERLGGQIFVDQHRRDGAAFQVILPLLAEQKDTITNG